LVSNGTAADPEWRNSAISGGGKIAFTYNTNSNNSGRTGYNNAAGFIQTDSLDYNALLYNIGSDFTITTAGLTGNFITINTTGTYHFEGLIKFFATNANPALPRAALKFRYDPPSAAFSEFIIREEVMREFNNSTTGGVNHDLGLGIPFSLDFFLVAGTTVTIMTELQPNNFPYLVLGVSSGGYIKGYRVTD
jgi:hypothetical protein